jgi:hypothetical protein
MDEEQRSQNSSSGTHRRALQIATEKFQKFEPVITQFISMKFFISHANLRIARIITESTQKRK